MTIPFDCDAVCRACGAPIRWVLGPELEQFACMNREPVADGPWCIEETRLGPALVDANHATGDLFGTPLRYVSHWTTCRDVAAVPLKAKEPRFEGRGPGRKP